MKSVAYRIVLMVFSAIVMAAVSGCVTDNPPEPPGVTTNGVYSVDLNGASTGELRQ